MKTSRLLLPLLAFLATPVFAQDYPYDDTKGSDSAASLPVEVPNQGAASSRVPKKPTALFRMSLKVGGNFTGFQDRLCTASSGVTCTAYNDRSYTGVGFEGRIGFGWDLAYQPVFIETEVGYLHKLANLDAPLKVLQIQQGFFHRERIGQDAQWKNGVLAALDLRIFQNANSELRSAALPAVGLSTMLEFGAFLTQLNFYVHEFRPSENHWSTSLLAGLRF
jgi:hypothetical protein